MLKLCWGFRMKTVLQPSRQQVSATFSAQQPAFKKPKLFFRLSEPVSTTPRTETAPTPPLTAPTPPLRRHNRPYLQLQAPNFPLTPS